MPFQTLTWQMTNIPKREINELSFTEVYLIEDEEKHSAALCHFTSV